MFYFPASLNVGTPDATEVDTVSNSNLCTSKYCVKKNQVCMCARSTGEVHRECGLVANFTRLHHLLLGWSLIPLFQPHNVQSAHMYSDILTCFYLFHYQCVGNLFNYLSETIIK